MADGPWYWCLDHSRVEPVDGCPNDRRLGPYATQQEAQDALARARERTAQQDAIDRDWEDET
ncbi:hypothetical protein E1212_03690 [Jiangella ureilytica]|uniref:SPOR domain-containing protein n=1 Tax=Jiangella ureilytica TaxID=2530374 RepID=A0A4R4RWW0_9ACTN|nr:hypothetical protein [Jiangella ureilytica]TDC53909.1 hypothetical protein E1212_03690 [Jiangella ureilytica]